MKPTITKEKLEEIRKRAEAATGGKWVAEVNDGLMGHRTYYRVFSDIETEYSEVTFLVHKLENEEDADFIANARQDIPALLDYIAEVEQELREATLIIDRVENLLSKMRYGTEYEVYDEVYRFLYGKGDEDDNV